MSLIAPRSPRGPNSVVKVKLPSERRSLSRSATRALDVMELFGAMRCPLRAIEVGKALGTNPSTTNQLLKTMVDSGHLFFDARAKTYLPSPRLAEFSSWISDVFGAGGRLRDLVRDVRVRTGMVATVSTPNDLFMQIVESPIPDGQAAERGLRISMFGSAIGSAYLAMLERGEVVRLARRARIPDRDIERIVEETQQIRRDGSADGASLDETIWSLALPLPPSGFSVPMVLGLAGPSDEVRAKLAVLRQIMSEAISRELGGRD